MCAGLLSIWRARSALVLGLLLSGSSVWAERGEPAYTLKLQITQGEKYSFDVTTSMNQKGQVTANGQVAQQIDQGFEQHRKGTIEVLEVAGGMPSSIRIAYDPESSNTPKAGTSLKLSKCPLLPLQAKPLPSVRAMEPL